MHILGRDKNPYMDMAVRGIHGTGDHTVLTETFDRFMRNIIPIQKDFVQPGRG